MSFHPAQFSIVHKDRQREQTSFVGIRRNGAQKTSFVLPPGFDKFPASDPETVSAYFFKLFRVLRVFRQHARRVQEDTKSDFAGERGVRVRIDDEDPAMLYTKIHMLEEVLERYDELRIYNILYRNRRTEEVDYSQIHRYLDKAVYQNDIPYVDEMRRPRPVIEMRVSTLVRMFCFIYAEVAPRTGKPIDPQVQVEAKRFKEEHLAPDSALFGSMDVHRRTIDQLKRTLNDIDREVAYKDEDYWYFFEAVEVFLYGELDEDEEGISWGITRFAPVWEDMCTVWMHRHRWEDVMYADSERYANQRIGGHDLFVDPGFEPPFDLELNGSKRFMRPDLVRRSRISPQDMFNTKGQQGGRVKVSVREEKRNPTSLKIIQQVRSLVRSKSAGGVTKRTQDQKWSYTFYGVGESTIQQYIKVAGHREGLKGQSIVHVVDFKCAPASLYTGTSLGHKAQIDERKQITYEYALQLSGESETRSQLSIPAYYESSPGDIGHVIPKEKLHPKLKSQGMDVLRVDFDQVLDDYLDRRTDPPL
jgi:hypothetical protein